MTTTTRATRSAQRVALLGITAALGLGCATAGSQAGVSITTTDHVAPSERVCFPRATWGPARQGLRPCARITRVYEDGSVGLRVSDADGTTRYTTGIGALDR